MSVTYTNAPLVELIVELRWGATSVVAPGSPQMLVLSTTQTKDEEIFTLVGAGMSAAGYGRNERLIPQGFLVPPAQPAYRFRPTNIEEQSPLFQLGQGIFTANALPPYNGWSDFSPVVRKGIEILFESHKRAAAVPLSIQVAVVRYINAFRDGLTNGRPAREFMRDVMGVNVVLPKVVLSKASEPDAIQQNLQVAFSTDAGRLEMSFGEGRHGNERAVMLTTAAIIQRDLGSDVESIMSVLTDERQMLHELFRGLTEPLHSAMEPKQ
jgi:uncharacterized protein (TIGR04255 family)